MKQLKRLSALFLALASLSFLALPTVAEGYPTLTATAADDWTALFDRRGKTQTWLGADGIYSVAIDGNDAIGSADEGTKTFFIFSDSLMGTSDASGKVTWAPGQPSQTSAVLTGNTPTESNIRFVWGPGGNGQFGSSKHLFGEHKWMLDCFTVDDAVYIFGFPEESWKPKQIDMIKIPIENGEPAYGKYSKTAAISDLWYRDGDTYLYAYGIAVTKNTASAGAENPDGYIYIYGYRDAMQEYSRKDLIVSRIKESDFPDFSKTTYWDGTSWSDNIADSAPVLQSVSCEMSVTQITSGPYKDKWIAIYTQNTESASMMYAIGNSPVGPFRNPTCFYTAPEHGQDNGGMYTYNAKAHPHLSSDGKLLISYNCNNRNNFGRQTTVEYHPRFLWLDLDPLHQGDYGADEDDPNLAYDGFAIASSESQPASLAFDGDKDSSWKAASGSTVGEWLGVLWPQEQSIERLQLGWNANRPIENGYKIEASQDGETWTEVPFTMVREDKGDWWLVDTVTLSSPVTATAVRLVVTEMVSGKNDLECREMEVYGGTQVLLGDVNKNGTVSAEDLTALARHVGGIELITATAARKNADMNQDNAVDADDLTALARKVGKVD